MGVEVFLRTLGVRWPVTFYLVPGEDTCRILTEIRERAHEVWVHESVLENPGLYTGDVIHELCHASLAERVDPAFSSYYFSKKYGELKGEEWREFGQKAQMVYLAGSHVDVWVNDLRHDHWPELTEQDNNTFAQGVVGIINLGHTERLRDPRSFLAICQYQAEKDRRGNANSSDLFRFLRSKGIALDPRAMELVEYFKSLPWLKFEPKKDLELFEQSTQEVARILGLPINPRLVREDDRWVWEF
ncbi:MAG: hypothetical protein PHU73_03055 [Patescibacteria group bacterium]|nr:hypothetical protein [Patescibacteria group bacterium]